MNWTNKMGIQIYERQANQRRKKNNIVFVHTWQHNDIDCDGSVFIIRAAAILSIISAGCSVHHSQAALGGPALVTLVHPQLYLRPLHAISGNSLTILKPKTRIVNWYFLLFDMITLSLEKYWNICCSKFVQKDNLHVLFFCVYFFSCYFNTDSFLFLWMFCLLQKEVK